MKYFLRSIVSYLVLLGTWLVQWAASRGLRRVLWFVEQFFLYDVKKIEFRFIMTGMLIIQTIFFVTF
ncbi:hypothetical protein DSUL_50437 [Desulfovibrionales bacterium]